MITIILPVVKTRYLQKTLESINIQTSNNFKIIIIANTNDKDAIRTINNLINSILKKPFKIITNPIQLPIAKNFNKALELVETKYATILSDDDILAANFIESFSNLFTKFKNVDIAHCRCYRIDSNENVLGLTRTVPVKEDFEDFFYHRLIGSRDQYLSDFVFNVDKLLSKQGFDETIPFGYGIDDIAWMKLAEENDIRYINKPLLYYRVHINSVTSTNSHYKERLKGVKYKYEFFRKNNYIARLKATNSNYRNINIEPLFQKALVKEMAYILGEGIKNRNILSKLVLAFKFALSEKKFSFMFISILKNAIKI